MEPSDDALLQDFNQRQTEANTPVIVYVAVVIFLGIIGNGVAAAFYGRHVKSNVTTFLLTVLSVNDFITSVVSVSAFVNLTNTVTFHSLTGCTIMFFSRHVFAAISNGLLLLIAIDRYLKIRWTFSKVQMSKRSAIVAVAILLTYNILMACRDFFLLETSEIEIRLQAYNRTITGHYCTYSFNPAYQRIRTAFNIVDMTYVALIYVSLAILYTAIGKWVVTSNKRRLIHSQDMRSTDVSFYKSSSDANKADYSNASNKQRIQGANGNERSENKHAPDQRGAETRDKLEGNQGTTSKSDVSLRIKSNMENSSVRLEQKLTLMVFVISVASVLTFVPYFVIAATTTEPNPAKP